MAKFVKLPGEKGEFLVNPETDGAVLGYHIHFGDGADPDILQRIPGLVNGRWVRVGPVL